MVPICSQAPTWTFVRLQPSEHQLCFVKAPTLDLGAPTPRTPILSVLRHQPQGLQPSIVKAPTLDIGAPTPRTPILPTLRLQIQGIQPNLVKACLIVILYSQNSSLLNFICLQLHCSLHATTSMATNLHTVHIESAKVIS